eukprot:TRINITY_DN1988_c0_g1_i5.p1 TRINITY_DN1988_c0_g1~~TRINITY_DN1988_c0_g1_i5.p1  ORF type:complete len:281 (+),score=59.38 TRINITY_DN1988_c0_g1_i5:750-1592(+)
MPSPPPTAYHRMQFVMRSSMAGGLDGGSERVLGGMPMRWKVPMGFHAKFFKEGNFSCAGTLITRRHLLTAAHCKTNANMTVRLGGFKLDEGLEISIGRVTTHPQYSDTLTQSDVAVVELGREVTLREMETNGFELVRLNKWPKLPKTGVQAALTGWGFRTEGQGGETANHVIIAQLTVLDVRSCNARYERTALPSIRISEELCAGGSGKRSCNGDSGGPLWSVDGSRGGKGFVQFGIVSTAVGSKRFPCDNQWPTVFMRTSYYYAWIAETVGKAARRQLL